MLAPVALPSVVCRFQIGLADADRGVYEELDWRVARHPSETERYLVARVLARALEHAAGLEFSKGGVSSDEPALVERDLTGALRAWIEVGAPSPERLHKATKACGRVVVYAWKDPERLAAAIVEAGVHRAEHIELHALPIALLDALAATLDRTNRWELAVSGRVMYATVDSASHEAAIARVPIVCV